MKVIVGKTSWEIEVFQAGWYEVKFCADEMSIAFKVQASDDYEALRAGKVMVSEKINKWAGLVDSLMPEADLEYQRLYDILPVSGPKDLILERMGQVLRYKKDGTPPDEELRLRLYRELGLEYHNVAR